MRTINKIITPAYGKGRKNVGSKPTDKKVFDCLVPMNSEDAYDKGGAYWGRGKPLRVSYTKDLTYIKFYRTK